MRCSAGLTRWDRSPAAIAPAVAAILSSGRRPTRIRSQAKAASASSTAAITISSMLRSRVSVWLTLVSGIAIVIVPMPVSLTLRSTRYCRLEPASELTVISLGCAGVDSAITAGSFGGEPPSPPNSYLVALPSAAT